MSSKTVVLSAYNRFSAVSKHEPGAESITWTSDESLLLCVSKGQQDALAELFSRHGRKVFNVGFRILKDSCEAADLRQDVFMYLHERAFLYDPDKSTAVSWIIQITYHRAINRRRYLTLRQHYNLEQLSEDRTSSSLTSSQFAGIDIRSLLGKLNSEVTIAQRLTIELHLFDGYTFREIATITGETLGNVRNHYYRGIDRLRSIVYSKNEAR